ncbi:MAG: ADP-ribosylglycohydrolase family protein, partial [Candidatus Spechtbacteria bacterium]|nr:ADP-ribosylglycohydrolase family protein [Candidatus Spechtbacteria bacterium]
MNVDKFLGCTLGLLAGDQIGSTVERMTACEIQSRCGEISDFLPESHRTDDSQTYLATMQAYIDANGRFDMDAIAERHVEVSKNEWAGWGRSTRKSCQRLESGVHWSKSGEPGGSGNGVIPRITVLGLRQSLLREDIVQFCEDGILFAKMTHLGTPAIVSAIVHAVSIASLAGRSDSKLHIYSHLQFLKQVAEATEEMLLAGGEERISKQISRIMSLIRFENLEDEDGVQEGGDSLEKKSILCRASIEEINSWFGGGGSYAYHSFGFSYALFARCALKRQLGEHVH